MGLVGNSAHFSGEAVPLWVYGWNAVHGCRQDWRADKP